MKKPLNLYTLEEVKFACNLYSDSSSQTLGYDWICNRIKELKEIKEQNEKEKKSLEESNQCDNKTNVDVDVNLNTINNNLLLILSDQLNKWIEQCESQAEIFNKNNMDVAAISSEAMAQAYWNIKQFLDVNK